MKKFNVNFHKVSDPALLSQTKRGHAGFGQTGVEVIKKVKESESVIEMITSEGEQVTVNLEDNLQVISKKAKDDLQITSEKAVMEVNNEVVISESITIDEQITQTTLYIIFLLLLCLKKCTYSFELVKSKNQKYEIHDIFKL